VSGGYTKCEQGTFELERVVVRLVCKQKMKIQSEAPDKLEHRDVDIFCTTDRLSERSGAGQPTLDPFPFPNLLNFTLGATGIPNGLVYGAVITRWTCLKQCGRASGSLARRKHACKSSPTECDQETILRPLAAGRGVWAGDTGNSHAD